MDAVLLVDDRNIRDGLRKRNVDGRSCIESPVEFVRRLSGRALRCADAAARAVFRSYGTGMLCDLDSEVSDEARHIRHLRVGEDPDIRVLVDLCHSRSEDAGRAVERRECLVQLAHASADGRKFFDDVDLVSGIRNVKSRLDSCDSAADDQGALCNCALAFLKRAVQIDLCDSCLHQRDRLRCSFLHILVDPGTLLTDIGDLYHERIDAGLLGNGTECSLMHTRRAGADHDCGKTVILDCLGDQILTVLGTHICVVNGIDHARLMFGCLGDFGNINRSGDVCAAVTDKYTDSLHLISPPLTFSLCAVR